MCSVCSVCVWMCVVSAWTYIMVLLLVPIKPANYCILCVCLYNNIDSTCLFDWTNGWLSQCRKDAWSRVHRLVKMLSISVLFWAPSAFYSPAFLSLKKKTDDHFMRCQLELSPVSIFTSWLFLFFSHKRKFLSLSLTCAHSPTGAIHFLCRKIILKCQVSGWKNCLMALKYIYIIFIYLFIYTYIYIYLYIYLYTQVYIPGFEMSLTTLCIHPEAGVQVAQERGKILQSIESLLL